MQSGEGTLGFLIHILLSDVFLSGVHPAHWQGSTHSSPARVWHQEHPGLNHQRQFGLAESDIPFFEKGDECCLTLCKGKSAVFKGKPRCSLCLKTKRTQKPPLKALQWANKKNLQQIRCSRETLLWEMRPFGCSHINKQTVKPVCSWAVQVQWLLKNIYLLNSLSWCHSAYATLKSQKSWKDLISNTTGKQRVLYFTCCPCSHAPWDSLEFLSRDPEAAVQLIWWSWYAAKNYSKYSNVKIFDWFEGNHIVNQIIYFHIICISLSLNCNFFPGLPHAVCG